MVFKKSTRYALYAAMEMARAGSGEPVTVTQVAERYGISASVLAKIFQQLVRVGIASSTRGVRGGYSLRGLASQVTVLDVIEAFESPRSSGGCLLAEDDETDCSEPSLCRLKMLIDEVDQQARFTYASVTLETLIGNRPPRELTLRVVQ